MLVWTSLHWFTVVHSGLRWSALVYTALHWFALFFTGFLWFLRVCLLFWDLLINDTCHMFLFHKNPSDKIFIHFCQLIPQGCIIFHCKLKQTIHSNYTVTPKDKTSKIFFPLWRFQTCTRLILLCGGAAFIKRVCGLGIDKLWDVSGVFGESLNAKKQIWP